MKIDTVIPTFGNKPPDAPGDGPAGSRLRDACRAFESLFVAQLLKEMRKTVPKSEFFGSGEEEAIFREMLDAETAKTIADSGAMKLAELLYCQLYRQK